MRRVLNIKLISIHFININSKLLHLGTEKYYFLANSIKKRRMLPIFNEAVVCGKSLVELCKTSRLF